MPCRVMTLDFQLDHGEGGYEAYDLEQGIDYAVGLMELGYTEEPLHEWNLAGFVAWAVDRLEAINEW